MFWSERWFSVNKGDGEMLMGNVEEFIRIFVILFFRVWVFLEGINKIDFKIFCGNSGEGGINSLWI